MVGNLLYFIFDMFLLIKHLICILLENYFNCNYPNDLTNCAKLIDDGGIVIFPTDTVYGIGCDPTNENAVIRLFQIKNRQFSKFLPILTNSIEHVSKYAYLSLPAKILIKNFWPGKLTLILKCQKNSSSLISKYTYNSNAETIAFRIPDNPCTNDLIKKTKNNLLIGTSANLSGSSPITSIDQIKSSGLMGYNAILDGGVMHNSAMVSSIVDLSDEKNITMLREGKISSEKIFNILQTIHIDNINEI